MIISIYGEKNCIAFEQNEQQQTSHNVLFCTYQREISEIYSKNCYNVQRKRLDLTNNCLLLYSFI